MHRRSLILVGILLLSLPLFGSQFVQLPFDQVARGADYIVQGTVENTWTAWDDSHEVIFTYATVRVQRYFGEATGPDTLTVREVGGTVDGYTQEAIGFPAIRDRENVVLFLSRWDDGGAEYRIHAYNQGKFLVEHRGGMDVAVEDMVKQGDGRLDRPEHHRLQSEAIGMPLDELAAMIDAARAGERIERQHVK